MADLTINKAIEIYNGVIEQLLDIADIDNILMQIQVEAEERFNEKLKNQNEYIRMGNKIIHDQVVTMQCALIELSQRDQDAAEQWLFNALEGPGHVPTTDDLYHDNANHWWGANCYDKLPKCLCGNPSHILMNGVSACSAECWSFNDMMRDLRIMNRC